MTCQLIYTDRKPPSHKKEIVKVAGILYFHSLLESDMAPSHHNLRALGQVCGNKAAEKVTFVLEGDVSSPTAQKAEISFHQNYGNLMKGLGAEVAYFDNTAPNGWRIVDKLLGPQSEDVSLLLQDELFVWKRSLHETYAARQLYIDLIPRLKKRLGALHIRSDSTEGEYRLIQAELEALQDLF